MKNLPLNWWELFWDSELEALNDMVARATDRQRAAEQQAMDESVKIERLRKRIEDIT